MGFLDFLKREKTASSAASMPMPPKPPVNVDPALGELPKSESFLSGMNDKPDQYADLFAPAAPAPASTGDVSSSSQAPPVSPAPAPSTPVFDLPPAAEPAGTPALKPVQQEQDAAHAMTSLQSIDAPADHDAWSPQPLARPRPAMDLPDFSDEDIAAIENFSPAVNGSADAASATSVDASSAALGASQAHDLPPMRETVLPDPSTAGELYLAAQGYFTVTEEVRTLRKTLRKGEDSLREAALRHEQTDEQYKKIAADINSIQERLMELDGALFGE